MTPLLEKLREERAGHRSVEGYSADDPGWRCEGCGEEVNPGARCTTARALDVAIAAAEGLGYHMGTNCTADEHVCGPFIRDDCRHAWATYKRTEAAWEGKEGRVLMPPCSCGVIHTYSDVLKSWEGK